MQWIVFCVILVMSARLAQGARRVDAKEELEKRLAALGGGSHRAKREARRLAIRELLEAGPQTNLQVLDSSSTVQGTTLWKLQETFQGKEVFDAQVTVETDPSGAEILDASGSFVQGIEEDTDGSPTVYTVEAVNNVLREFGDTRDHIMDLRVEIKIFTDNDGQALPGYFVEYRVEDDERPRRPTAVVDGRTGKVLMKWNALTTYCQAEGIGGNDKIGEIRYDPRNETCLEVTKEGDVCYLENDEVRVINMHQLRWYNITDTWFYDCQHADDGINGAYSPALDAFYIGISAFKMFRDWYGMRPVKNPKLVIRVHYGDQYANAYWNGVNCTFGDGRGFFHPFVAVDLVGHEIGHAVVEQNSGLIWYREPGAVNEAFADITGEVLEYYMKGQDWLVGADVNRGQNGEAVRYFVDPTENVLAISHMDHLDEYMEPHETGGILAHAFYRIVKIHNQDIKEAYRVFLHANKMYWHHMSSITSAACELMKSAYDLGQPGDAYQQAFEHVGIKVCSIDNHITGLRNNQTYTGIRVSSTIHPVFTFSVPGQWTQTVFVTANSAHGGVHIAISNLTWMSAYEPDQAAILAEGEGYVAFSPSDPSQSDVTITLSSSTGESRDDVSLLAGYTCVPPGRSSHRIYERMRREKCEGRDY